MVRVITKGLARGFLDVFWWLCIIIDGAYCTSKNIHRMQKYESGSIGEGDFVGGQPSTRADVSMPGTVSRSTFVDMLAAQSINRGLKKAERTRYLLLSKIAERIRQNPTGRITVEMLLNDAGLSRGTFYNYFNDVDEGIYVLLALFLETWNEGRPTQRSNQDFFKAIYATNLSYCLRYEENASFFAAFSYYASSMEKLLDLRNEINASWAVRTIRAVERRFQLTMDAAQRTYLEGVVRMLILMSTGTLEEYYVYQNAQLRAAFRDAHELAFALSRQWYPALSNPAFAMGEMVQYEALRRV